MKTTFPLLLLLLDIYWLGNTFDLLYIYILCIEVTYKSTTPYTVQPKLSQ